ncbi:MAG: hypothetical protein EHM19_06350 [Candidatus Latescibacterota bacterium]|nr:MAG: hypothetical protein EHM19_06350 [Candidatus Latescibacterota bacterium]
MNARARFPRSVVVFSILAVLAFISCGDDDSTSPGCEPEWSDLSFTVVREAGANVAPFWALSGSSEDDLFGLSEEGVYRFDGSTWQLLPGSAPPQEMNMAWGASAGRFFATTEYPFPRSLMHFDGTSWSEHSIPLGAFLYDVWEFAPDRAYAVGWAFPETGNTAHARADRDYARGVILRYDGTEWKQVWDEESPFLLAVHGDSEDNLYAVGSGGRILHFDGEQWSDQEGGGGRELAFVRVGEDGVAFAVDMGGAVLAQESGVWALRSSGFGQGPRIGYWNVWGTSVQDIWAVVDGISVWHFDGSAWSDAEPPYGLGYLGVWGSQTGEPFCSGHNGGVLHWTGGEWHLLREGTRATLWAIDGTPGGPVIAGGYYGYGHVVRLEGGEWRVPPRVLAPWIHALWLDPSGGVVHSGSAGDFTLLVRQIGSDFDTLSSWYGGEGFGPNGWFDSIHGWPSGDFIEVGWRYSGGCIYHSDGSTFSSVPGGRLGELFGVWGVSPDDVFAVGRETVVHWDGTAWSRAEGAPPAQLRDVWGLSDEDVFAVGSGGAILYYDGSSWTPQVSGTTALLFGVWGSPRTGMIAVGSGGTVLHYDGCAWSPCAPVTDRDLYGVWGSDEDGIFAVGEDGIILWAPTPPAAEKKPCAGSSPDVPIASLGAE